MWVAAHVAWLAIAYQLEVRGSDVFTALWLASVVVFVANNGLIYGIACQRRSKAPPAAL